MKLFIIVTNVLAVLMLVWLGCWMRDEVRPPVSRFYPVRYCRVLVAGGGWDVCLTGWHTLGR